MIEFKIISIHEGGKQQWTTAQSQLSAGYLEAVAQLEQFQAANNIQHTYKWLDLNRLEDTWIYPNETIQAQWKIVYNNTYVNPQWEQLSVLSGHTKSLIELPFR